jgi:YbbR domain-containing protein
MSEKNGGREGGIMKKKWMGNLPLKILSVVVAFLFWLVIINLTDPTTARTFYDIPVQVLNENVITSANQVYEIVDGDTVDVTVRGKRSFVETLDESDFSATADMSELSKVNAVSINVKLEKKQSDDNYELDSGNAMLKVKLEKRVTRKFKVEVEHQGELSENYVLGEMVAKPNIVEVSCGESKFKKIDHVGVMVLLKGESEDFDAEYSPVLYDSDGEVLDSANVTFSNDKIKVSTTVQATKEVSVKVNTTGMPADGYRLVQTDYKPESIRVCGTKEALEKASTIQIPISVEGAKSDVEKEEPIINYLADGLSIVGNISTISVRCEIEKNGQRSFTLTSSDIAVKNLPSDCTMVFATDAQKYQVILTGTEKALSKLTQTNLGAYVDLQGMLPGSHTMDVQFTLPDGVKLKNSVRIKVILQSQDEDDSDITEEDNEEPEETDVPEEEETPAQE